MYPQYTSHYPVSNRTSGLSHPGSLYDDSVLHEMRQGHRGPSHTGNRSTNLDGETAFSSMTRGYADSRAPTYASSSRATRHSDHPHHVEPSHARRPSHSRAFTVHPDDSISNYGRPSHRHREPDTRGRSRGSAHDRRQLPLDTHPPTLPSDSGYRSRRHRSPSITHDFAYDASPTYTYRAHDPRHRPYRSCAPSPGSRTSRSQAVAGAYRSSTSSRALTAASSGYSSSRRYGGSAYSASQAVPGAYRSSTTTSSRARGPHGHLPPPPPPVLRGRTGGYVSSISSVMGPRGDFTEEEEFEYLQARMSGL